MNRFILKVFHQIPIGDSVQADNLALRRPSMRDLISRYLRDEEGQTSTEYILLVAVVAMIVIKFREKLNQNLNNITDNVFQKTNNFIDSDFN